MAQGNNSGNDQQGLGDAQKFIVGTISVMALLLIVGALYTGFGGRSIKFLNFAA